MRSSKPWIRDRILLLLDQRPCHGYELSESLDTSNEHLRLTTLYRWLNEMEEEGYVISEILPGPHGPNRRVYRIGPRGETRLREILRDSIEVVLHFFNAYRSRTSPKLFDAFDELEPKQVKGRVLFVATPWLKEQDLQLLMYLLKRNNGTGLLVMGDNSIVRAAGIRHRPLKGDLTDIHTANCTISEIWISGVPKIDQLPQIISECKRILISGGTLRLIAPFVFFDEPTRPTVSEFIRVTAVHLLPDLGVVEGNTIGDLFEAVFTKCGANETSPRLAVFWGIKE